MSGCGVTKTCVTGATWRRGNRISGPKWLDAEDPTEPDPMIPIVRDPDNIMIVVAGDPARSRSAFCPARPYNRPVTRQCGWRGRVFSWMNGMEIRDAVMVCRHSGFRRNPGSHHCLSRLELLTCKSGRKSFK